MTPGDTLPVEAIYIAKLAGERLKQLFSKHTFDTETKGSPFDIVTSADREIDRYIVEQIKMRFPDHAILTEESGESNSGAEWQWVIDPIDGTTNFSTGLPHFNISVGIKHNGETKFGVVFDPIANRCFYAGFGLRASLNENRIQVSKTEHLSQAVVATGFPYNRATNPDNNINAAAHVAKQVRGLRLLGSAALDICYVAAGMLDAFWEMDLHEWDVCAALCIAESAGAVVTHYRTDRGISVLVANRPLTEQLLPIITPR